MSIRTALYTSVAGLALLALSACDRNGSAPAQPSASTPTQAARHIQYEVSSGSWMSVDVSPDGRKIVFDLIGHIYELPIEGGTARALTRGREWNRSARYSPDGSLIALVRDGAGPDDVWVMSASGGEPRRVTDHWTKDRDWVSGVPSWAPDGKSITYGEYDDEKGFPIFRVDLASGQSTPLEKEVPKGVRRTGVFTPDGKVFYFTERSPFVFNLKTMKPETINGAETQSYLVRLDLATGKRTVLTDIKAGIQEITPQISADGRTMVYIRHHNGRIALRAVTLDAAANPLADTDRELVELPNEDVTYRSFDDHGDRPGYAITPDNASVVIGTGGKIHKIALADGKDSIIPFKATIDRTVPPLAKARTRLPDGNVDIIGVQWPRLTPDEKTLVFGAIGYVWVQALPHGEPKRLTKAGDDVFEFSPALSPDGKTVAYTELKKSGIGVTPGRLVTVALSGGEPHEIVAEGTTPLAPAWSPDGTKLAFIRDAGPKSHFAWVSLQDRKVHNVLPVQQAQRETWGRLVAFSKDGNSLLCSWEVDPVMGRPDATELVSIPLEGGTPRAIARGGRDARGMLAAPDGKHVLVMGIDDDLWLQTLPADGSKGETDLNDANLPRITKTGAEFVDWRGDDSFIYSFANKIYRHDFAGGEPKLFHTVKLSYPRHQGKGVVAFTNARIITVNGNKGAGEVIEKGTLVVRDRRIEAVGPSDSVKVPQEAKIIDGTGLTLMPAVGDMHYHSQGGTNLLSKMLFPSGELGLPQSIPYGVTMGWQPGGPTRNGGGIAIAELQQTGRIPGPRWINAPWAVNMITYGDNYKSVIGTYADALRSTQHRADLNGTVMKEYMTRRRDHRQWFGDAAREIGVGIVSHVQGLGEGLSRATDGYTGIDHPAFPMPIYEDVREYLARTGTIWTVNMNAGSGEGDDAQRIYVRELLKRFPEQQAKWDYYYSKRKLDAAQPTHTREQIRLFRVAKAAAFLMAGGAKIGISAHNPPPLFALTEMWYLQEGGADRGDIIRAGTMVGAEKMGLDHELGSLEKGKVADIMVLEANPLEDMLNLATTRYVLADGVVYDAKAYKSAPAR